MPQYAYYDPSISPSQVKGWYDTDLVNYTNLPSTNNLFLLTAEQWAGRMTNPSGFAIQNGTLVSYTPPPMTPET
jgi:hypothetical protein